MSLKKVLVLAEGETEAEFIEDVLVPYFRPQLELVATKVTTRMDEIHGKVFKGGIGTYHKVARNVQRLLQDSSATLVTTLLDFYGLPNDFPGYAVMPLGDCYRQVEFLTEAFRADIGHPHFLPYFSLHEFEALLFADVQKVAMSFSGHKLAELQKIRNEYNTPEEINLQQPPSKRLLELFPAYNKTFHGVYIVNEIGVDRIRQECPHFNTWIASLEDLGQ